jgi:ribosomal protein S12 methylthiotransferase accessory factor
MARSQKKAQGKGAAVARGPNRLLNEGIPSDVTAAITDPARFSPMLAGASCIRGSHLTVRCPGEDIDIHAPAALLQQVFTLCDGTRTIDEILKALPAGRKRTEFGEFMQFLLSENALIDANLASAHAARYAFQFSPFGLAAPSQTTDQICRRFLWNPQTQTQGKGAKVGHVPLQAQFDARVSTYTFGDKPLTASILHKLLWSLAGVVRSKHPRVGHVTPQRTIASAGGMHLVEVYLTLQRPVGPYAPGVYRVTYPQEQAILLQALNQMHGLLPLAFGKPWELTHATGAVFLAADPVVAAMRYRSRSLQYLFMEAGAALHNGALSADALGLGFATIGGYYEGPVSRLCELGKQQLVLGSALFGARPSQAQIDMISRSPDLDFAWVNGESARFSMGFHLARAKVKTPDDQRPHTWGRGTDPWLAMRKAIAEAIEREGFREPRHITEGSFAQIDGALHPSQFVCYLPSQYAQPDFFYQPFDPEQRYAWAQGTCGLSGKPVHVLAELVFSRASLAAHGHATDRPFTQVTSSGCAASTSLADATLRALLEVVERDAFMRHWLQQVPGKTLARAQFPKSIAARVNAIEATGCRISLQQLPSPWAHVALVSAQHTALHFTTMGTAAGADFVSALESALDEVEARVYAWVHGHSPSIRKPEEVRTTEHHFELYGLKQHFQRANRVLFPQGSDTLRAVPRSLRIASANDLLRRFAVGKTDPVLIDITPRHCHVDQGRTPLSVVKALVPGLLPISFGYQREPLGMVPRVHPGSKFPHPFP